MCVLFIISIPLLWQCYTSESNACIRIDTTYYTQKAQYTQSFVTSHVTRPFVSNLQNVWMTRDKFVYTPIRIMHNYYRTTALPILNSTKESLHLHLIYWKKELDNYINQSTESDDTGSEHNLRDSVVEEKLKKTARRILEFIDLKQKTGMQQDQAKEKAREIIKSIKQETNFQEKEELEEKKYAEDVDIISFEIRAIAQVARAERSQLQQQLELLQTRLVNGKDTDLVISALKLEIDQLRANAENKVRKRTDRAVSQINKIISPTSPIGIEMAQQIQKARRDALKDLRIVYRDIYQINQLIEDMGK